MTAAVDTQRLQDLGLLQQQPKLKEKEDLGQDEFFKLMTTQLQNQDPFKPLESGEFLGQIAQFAQVRGIEELKTTFTDLAGSLHSNQALQAAGLVGRTVLVEGEQAPLIKDYGLYGEIDLPNGADQVEVAITAPGGERIGTLNLGKQNAGRVPFSWDGKTEEGTQLPPGVYGVKATARVDGQAIASQTLVEAGVDSVTFGGTQNELKLNLVGIGAIDFGAVKAIR